MVFLKLKKKLKDLRKFIINYAQSRYFAFVHYLSIGFLFPKVRPYISGSYWLFLSSTIFNWWVMYDLSKGGFCGCPVSGKKTANVCWYPLNCRYYLINSFIMRFSFERSGLFGGVSFNVLKIYALILARIWERTPRYSRVSFRTSFNSFIEAIFFRNLK